MESLDTGLMVAVAGSLVVWWLVSARLEAFNISAPMAFVAAGLVLANAPISAIEINIRSATLEGLAEVTLALLLFSDAARVNLRVLRHDTDVMARLLLLGLPITIGLSTAVAVLLFPGLDPWAAAAIAAAVAPTDAALGAQVVEDEHVPGRIRRILNVESGLNDGIATPFVTFFVAGAVADTVTGSSASLDGALSDLAIGVIVGAAVGLIGGFLLTVTHKDWAAPRYRGIGASTLALGAYALSIELGGNGFIAAFVGGLAFGSIAFRSIVPVQEQETTLEFDTQAGKLLSLVVWFLFGAAMVPTLDETTWETAVFAILALTVLRMLPVALVLWGTGFSRSTVAFVGWFGPRGLASIVFGLLAFDSLEGSAARGVLVTVTLTVLLSVVAHGVSAAPLSRRYGEHVAALQRTHPNGWRFRSSPAADSHEPLRRM